MNAPSTSVDITRLNRKQRRDMMRSGKMGFMIPGRHLPFVKKTHGEIKNFYALRDREIAEENKDRLRHNMNKAATPDADTSGFTTTAIPDKPLGEPTATA